MLKRLLLLLSIFAASVLIFGCAGEKGSDGKNGADGTNGAKGDAGDSALPAAPALSGHSGGGGLGGYILAYDVQAAYNSNTFFWRVSYRGNEGKRHDYYRYTNGAWRQEGGDRRDAQSTIDQDELQGETDLNSTIYEQRTSIMVNDPSATANVTNFGKFGCFLTCHNDLRHMPEWEDTDGEDTKYVNLAETNTLTENTPVLDLWHWRAARSNPIARADDQNILAKTFTNAAGTDDGGRKGDSGAGVFSTNSLSGGNPSFVFDPVTTWGSYAPKWDNFWLTPFYYFVNANAAQLGSLSPNPVVMAYADAVTAGYTPSEGDFVPRRILAAGGGSHADITSYGTQFNPESADGNLGIWHVQMQRAINTGNADDVAFVAGNQYDVGFEVHLWEYTTRDHYVSFPQTLGVGSAAASGADIVAVDAATVGGAASGTFPLPDWSQVPPVRLYLFQPGISTWEFLSGANATNAKVYTDPVTSAVVDQTHGGSDAVSGGTNACEDCHNVRSSDTRVPPIVNAGAMEARAKLRGGIWADTPHE
ncbi:MAG: hypothetical protein HY342_01320 [Candidatus Lambdaproteobacteria bacterium]|nr:hypothetical protein [Candidatus Lambdaproteobacteria bacterium]